MLKWYGFLKSLYLNTRQCFQTTHDKHAPTATFSKATADIQCS